MLFEFWPLNGVSLHFISTISKLSVEKMKKKWTLTAEKNIYFL